MKDSRQELSQHYHTALVAWLKQEPGASLQPARNLGQQAMDLGMEILELARIHEIALVSLVRANQILPDAAPVHPPCNGLGKSCYLPTLNAHQMGRAGLFFAETITPIELTHRGAREANLHLNKVVKALGERTMELADSILGLKQEIIQRREIEESLRTSEQTSTLLLQKSQQMQEQLRHLSRQLLTIQEEERRKISRELHDVTAQTLTCINLRLAALKTDSNTSTQDLIAKIASTQILVEKSVEVVHRFARELRPTVLDDLGLIPALESFLKGFLEETGIRVTLTAVAGIEAADSEIRTMLYRIAQEALTNVSRHAKANHASVTITSPPGLIRMEIQDDGQGFNVEGSSAPDKPTRLGLLGMRERAEMTGGTLCIESSPGHPTTVRVEVPLKAPPPGSPPPHLSGTGPLSDCS